MTAKHKVSPSQIKTAFHFETGCKRKWAFNKIDGIESPSTAAQTLGTRVHSVAEEYFRNGTVPNLKSKPGRIFAAGLHLLPPRDQVHEVEHTFDLRFNASVVFHGIIDFMGEDFIGDHKTTSNFDYLPTTKALRVDAQAVIYGMYLATIRKMKLQDQLKLRWVYYLTRGKPQSRLIEIETTRAELEQTYFTIARQADELIQLRETVSSALEVEPNFNACGAYGGCPFIAKCNAHKSQSTKSVDSETTQKGKENMSTLLERLKARSEAAKVRAKAVPQIETREADEIVNINPPMITDQTPPAEVSEDVQQELELPASEKPTKKKRGRPKGSKNKPKASPKVEAVLAQIKTPDPKIKRAPMPDGYWEKAETDQAEASAEREFYQAGGKREAVPDVSSNLQADAEQAAEQIPKAWGEERARRLAELGPPPEESTMVIESPSNVGIGPAVQQQVQSQIETVCVLFINCLPSTGGIDITSRLTEIAEECAKQNGVEHYRFIRFGEAKARFSKCVRESLAANPLVGKVVVDSMSLMVADCLEELIAHASETVRAYR